MKRRPAFRAHALAALAAPVCLSFGPVHAEAPPPPADQWTVERAVDGTLQQISNRAIGLDTKLSY